MFNSSKTTRRKPGRSKRIGSVLPVCVNGAPGLTRDVSASGLYIVQDAPSAAGAQIVFTLDLDTPSGKLTLSCQGEVIRVEKVNAQFGLGIKILSQTVAA